ADMIEMLVAGEDEADVPDAITERADIVGDELGILFGRAVDQNVALVADDQDRSEAAGPDQIGVSMDADRRRGLVRVSRVIAGDSPARAGAFDRSARLLDKARPA